MAFFPWSQGPGGGKVNLNIKKRYHIFHLIKSLGRGGAEMLLGEGLAAADQNQFHYAYGYFLPWKDALVSSLKANGGEVVCFPCNYRGSIILSVPRVVRFLKTRAVDLVHCHLPLAGVVGRLSGRLSGIPVIYTEHNVIERYHPWTRRVNLLTWKLQDAVVAVSNEVKASIHAHAGNSVPVTVIRNGISVNRFVSLPEERKRIREQFGIPLDAPVVGTVAVFRPQKDLHNWLRTAQAIRSQFPVAHFLLVGDGVLRKELESFAASMGLSDVTHFTGLQEKVTPFYSAMDIYMSSSIFEGLPLALLEAMAMHLPVVATSVGGIPEVVSDEKNGFLVPPAAPEALFEKVAVLIGDPQMRKRFGAAGRSLVEENFNMKRMVQELEELYLRIIEKRSFDN